LRKLAVLLERPSWRRAVRTGVAAAIEHRKVPFGHDFATVVDVGAHHGQFALLALELFPRSSILCVEPLPDALHRLRAATAEADGRVTVLGAAAAAKGGRRELHVSRRTDSSSLLPILKSYVDAFPGTEEARTLEVRAETLDSLVANQIRRPCLLKVDAQGGELEVLAGAEAVLAQVDTAYVECSFVEFYRGQALADEVIAAFLRRGLRLDGVYSVVGDAAGRCLQADLLFQRDANARLLPCDSRDLDST
jgi:FkbM family methyltransferase